MGQNLTQHTLGHLDCPACEQASKLLYQALSPDSFFIEAFGTWIKNRTLDTQGRRTNARFLSEKSKRDYLVCAEALKKFFCGKRLHQIHVADVMEYQQLRATNPFDPGGTWRCLGDDEVCRGKFVSREEAEEWARAHGGNHRVVQTLWAYPAGANCIRKEIALLIRILRSVKLWGEDQEKDLIRLQPVENDEERALTIEEQHRLLHVGASRLEFRFIYQYAIVALQTTAATNELRAMRLCDVMLDNRVIAVPRGGAKNKYRMRTIPLVTEDAMWAMEGLVQRAKDLGARQPTDFLFPIQKARTYYDPKQHMSDSGLKKPWDALRCAAGLPELRLYDLRHTGITRMAEAGVPLPVAMSFAGHMTERMQRRYTAICMSAQRGWGEAVWGNGMGLQQSGNVAGAWGGKRKPVAAESVPMYQLSQHFHR